MKIYTAVQRILTNGNTIAYLNVDGDIAFTSNAKLTTYKRLFAEQVGLALTNWSYRVDSDHIDPGAKVYTIQQKVTTPDGSLYLALTDAAYASKREAKAIIDPLREANPGMTLCIFSFVVDAGMNQIDNDDIEEYDENGRPW